MSELSAKQEIWQELKERGLSPDDLPDWWGLVIEQFGNDFDKESIDDAIEYLIPILERLKRTYKSTIAILPSPSQSSLKKIVEDQALMTALKANLDESFEGIEVGIDASNRYVLRFHSSISRRALKELIDNLPLGRLNMKLRALWEFVHAHGVTKVTEWEEIRDSETDEVYYDPLKSRFCWVATLKKWNEFAPEKWQYHGKNPRAQFQMEFQRAEQVMKEGGRFKGKWKRAGISSNRLMLEGIEKAKEDTEEAKS
ncbi:MAG: hypothetical protein KIT45_12205 [Fimbriimonadia bacterium]|nr:hypothetical protein [Fimbriimonadia bacterium]